MYDALCKGLIVVPGFPAASIRGSWFQATADKPLVLRETTGIFSGFRGLTRWELWYTFPSRALSARFFMCVKADDRRVEIPKMSAKKQTSTEESTETEQSRYAIIATGGKQYRVAVGDQITVEKLDAEVGSSITIDQVLMIGGGGATAIGTPVVDGATVSADVVDAMRGEKIIVFKYKPKKRYRKRTGHRQSLTRLAITAINQ
jgi:large subunit ribosomal protein L21